MTELINAALTTDPDGEAEVAFGAAVYVALRFSGAAGQAIEGELALFGGPGAAVGAWYHEIDSSLVGLHGASSLTFSTVLPASGELVVGIVMSPGFPLTRLQWADAASGVVNLQADLLAAYER